MSGNACRRSAAESRRRRAQRLQSRTPRRFPPPWLRPPQAGSRSRDSAPRPRDGAASGVAARASATLPVQHPPRWTQPGSNRRPSRCQRDALPAELWALGTPQSSDTASRLDSKPMSHESAELLLRGYHAVVDGDFEAMAGMLDPDVEWLPAGQSEAIVISRDRVLEVVADRAAENYHVVVDRAIGLADRVVVSMRFSRIELDPSDERPLQSRRSYLLGRWAAVVHMRDGRVVRVEEHPHLESALEAAGLEAE